MNILILTTIGPEYQVFFKRVGDVFKEKGHTVVFAADSKLGDIEYSDFTLQNDNTYYFSKFIKSGADDKQIELPLDINYWELFVSDKDRFEHFKINQNKDFNWYKHVAKKLWNFFSLIFEKENIDFVFYENISNSFSYFAYECAKKSGISYIGIISSRLPNRYELVHGVNSQSQRIINEYNKLLSIDKASINKIDYVENYYQKFTNRERIVPDYMRFDAMELTHPSTLYLNKHKISVLAKRLVVGHYDENKPYYLGHPAFFSFRQGIRNLSRYLRAKLLKSIFLKINPQDKYYLYPLHFHPESSTSVLSPQNLNEYELIKNIANNLPFDTFLYVKDHISSYGFPKRSFYEDLRKIPNVKLLAPTEDILNLIDNSEGILTISSTVGYEALIMGKKVWTFGDVFYNSHPNCTNVTDIKLLFDELYHSRHNKENQKVDNYLYIYSYYKNSFDGAFTTQSTNEFDFVKLYENIISYYKSLTKNEF